MAKQVPASIRYNNPGAMWGGNPVSRKWGETGHVGLNDGLGQGNQIAIFPTPIQGACAQIDLWRTPRYHNKPFKDGIAMWSGHNNVPSYMALIEQRVPGMTGDTLMTDEFLSSESGLKFLKAQAYHEAGREYPMNDAQWREAQSRVFQKTFPPKPVKLLKTRTGQLGTASAVLTGVTTTSAIVNTITTSTDAVQTASDTVAKVKDAKDQVVVIYQTVKPFLGVMPETWRIVAITAGVMSLLFIAGVLWYRHVKIRDTGE